MCISSMSQSASLLSLCLNVCPGNLAVFPHILTYLNFRTKSLCIFRHMSSIVESDLTIIGSSMSGFLLISFKYILINFNESYIMSFILFMFIPVCALTNRSGFSSSLICCAFSSVSRSDFAMTVTDGMYTRLPSITSMNWSMFILSRITMSAFISLNSLHMLFSVSKSTSRGTVLAMSSPPFILLDIFTSGALWSTLTPTSYISFSIARLCSGCCASTSITIKSEFRTIPRTSFPRPFPSAAPSIIPGTSKICIFAPLYVNVPGITVSVVNAYAAVLLFVPVSALSSVDFPTLGNPRIIAVASPAFF